MAITINASTSAGLQLSSDTSGEIQLQDDGTTNLTLKPTGNVLIGRTADSTVGQGVKLDIVGGINASSLITTSGSIGVGVSSPTAALHLKAGVSGASGAPLKFTSGTNATVEAGAVEYDGTSMFMTPSANFGRATVPLTVYTSGAGTAGLSNAATTDYAMFPSTQDTITLPVGTYYVILAFRIYQTGSTATPVLNFNIRGPASGGAVGTFTWNGFEASNNGTEAQGKGAAGFNSAATALGTVVQIGTAATNPKTWYISGAGILKITTTGTIAPSYQWASALTSGTVTLYAQNYMLIQQLDTQSAAAFGPSGAGWG